MISTIAFNTRSTTMNRDLITKSNLAQFLASILVEKFIPKINNTRIHPSKHLGPHSGLQNGLKRFESIPDIVHYNEIECVCRFVNPHSSQDGCLASPATKESPEKQIDDRNQL